MLELGDTEEPFRLVGEAWIQTQQKPLQQLHMRMSLLWLSIYMRANQTSNGKQVAMLPMRIFILMNVQSLFVYCVHT